MTHVTSVSLLLKENEISVRFSSFKGMQVRNIIDLFILRAFHSSSVPRGHPGVRESEAITPCPFWLYHSVAHRGPPCFSPSSFYSLPPPRNSYLAHTHKKRSRYFFFRFRWSLRATQSGQRVSKDKEAKTVKKRWVHNYSHGSVVVGASMCEYTRWYI